MRRRGLVLISVAGLLWAALSIVFAGCVTRGALEIGELDRPLAELQRFAVASLPLGLRSSSPNRREFVSQYFQLSGKTFVDAREKEQRKTVRIVIFGDRRPYTVEFLVVNERRDATGAYVSEGYDRQLVKGIRERFQRLLNKRRDDGDVIDDFRAF